MSKQSACLQKTRTVFYQISIDHLPIPLYTLNYVTERAQHAGQIHCIKMGNRSFEKVEQFRYLGSTLRIKIVFRKK